MVVLGIDPGKRGAFAVYDSESNRVLKIWDMPLYKRSYGPDKIDKVDLESLLLKAKEYQISLAILELVGQRPSANTKGQMRAQTGMFEFGVAWGYIDILLSVLRLRYEYVPPAKWKRDLKCPSDKDEAVNRADQLFPLDRGLFRGPRGGKLDGRAEAAMLALWGSMNPNGIPVSPIKTPATKKKNKSNILDPYEDQYLDGILEKIRD